MSELKVYAIPNCNTVKKALDWLKANKVNFEFGISQKARGKVPLLLKNVYHPIIYPNKESRYQKRYHNGNYHS